MKSAFILFVVLTSSLCLRAEAEEVKAPAPLFHDLGHLHHPVTTSSKLAQRYFDQGFTLLYGFNHTEAIRSFEAVAKLDPNCAMAWWGVAYAYGPNINAPMFEASVPAAWQALQKALALRSKASEKEQAYIDALAARYAEQPTTNRAPFDLAYADAMRRVAKRYPEDLDAQTLFAEALMDTSPWNYWITDPTTGAKRLKPSAQEATDVIEAVLRRVRSHTGADHLYIHLVEAGPQPDKGTPSADRLAKLAPGAGHLVHMPSHIYLRTGRYHDATVANQQASAADESYLAQCKQQGMYPGGYYPHNLHFLWFAMTLEGRSQDSITAARKLSSYTTELRCGAIEGPRQRYVPLLAYARFGRWADILNEPEPPAEYPYDRAMRHYARGLALAATAHPAEAAAELEKFSTLEQDERVHAMDNPYFPGTKILAIAHSVLAGKVALASGKKDEGLQNLREAVQKEDAMPYMEPPYWYYPSRESLGMALLKNGAAPEAEKVFRGELGWLPASGRPLFGLEQSLRAQGKTAEADKVRREFQKAWKHADVKPDEASF